MRQAMPCPCALAGVAAGLQFAAGVGSPLVDDAGGLLANVAGECRAARAGMVGAAHAAGVRRHLHGQASGHASAVVLVLMH